MTAHVIKRPDGFEISDVTARLDLPFVHGFLSEHTYWATGRTLETVARSVANSVCLGVYDPSGAQVGFGRMVTDRTTTAHLTDVFISSGHRGLGLGKALVGAMLSHPDLVTVRRWTLSTMDAHAIYAAYGFTAMVDPEQQMMRMLPRP